MTATSFVYVLFEDGMDIYWARSRVLEYLNFVRDRLPRGVEPRLGPDATSIGWVLQYALEPDWFCPDHTKIRRLTAPGACAVCSKPLQRAGKSFDLQVGPDRGHSGISNERMMEFFLENLAMR